ncbi:MULTISPECIES: hypothetical protein [unclassified Polaribacter]|uniref:hypothetical protein n=1 Tax=unclassified Polaribacter TaxID=196858 RepID=UPI0011BDD6CE|nr:MULTISPECIES: hypothetical protein [unclassified Polaribacter]TXD53638.1 hypothetical protein ES043_03170 [Polaribacter sp. IC063]TXD62122.1 hypothetical protein ES044_02535 [Polaribacter sp. IC066]
MKLISFWINRIKKNKVISTILVACFFILCLLVFITVQAIVETENWKFFDIDFINKENIISGYSALLGAILSSISIILLVYTIYLQSAESKKQKKRFKKQHALQKKQFDSEKLIAENKERSSKFSLIKLISVFLDSIIKHI